MMGAPSATLAALLTLVLSIPDTARGVENSEARVVCYYTNWSVYRPGTAKFSPQNINPYLCTHLIYAFGGFTKENSLKPFDKYQDIEKGGYAKFTGLKTYNKNLKTMLAIGGWNEGSSRFSPMVANPERRKELIKNSIKFLRINHFDGLDLDWEYPSFRDGGKPRDRDNYAQLVQELREEFDRESTKTGRPRLLLTMAVPAGLEYIDKGYDIPKLNKYLDWMNILSYDYHSAFEPAVNHHSPLYSLEEIEDDEYNFDVDLNIDATIKHYLKAGADREKLVLGIPTYGRSYTLFNPDANEIGAPADGPGDMGEATRENGYLAYYEICENVKNEGWEVVQPNPRAMGPYAYKGNQWVGYDDEQIVKRKSQYVSQMGLGGIMFWAIDNDDFRGVCHGKPYPLIEAAKDALLNAATDNLVVSPPPKRTRISSKSKDTTTTTTRSTLLRNSGGRQGIGLTDEDTTKASKPRKRIRTGGSTSKNTQQRKPSGRRRRPTTVSTTPSTTTLLTTSRTVTTPEPPTTPDPGSDFKCEDEGFFPHPRDCKKYFWCLSSGPSDLGIIAHQFTCPSGLYFNKAADSCDYTQNVLCNIKKKKTTTSTTTTTTTTTTESPSTSRKPPRITAATSRTTYIFTSTTTPTPTPEYEDEYEYEDDDDEEEEEDREDVPESEEDPKVIKELIDLIKKVGGIEQLERHLNLQDDGSATVKSNEFTTPATISRSLYERVLSQSGTASPLLTTLSKSIAAKGRPQYTTITRKRPQAPAKEEEIEEEEVLEEPEDTSRQKSVRGTTLRPGQPEYVTIRRTRPPTTTSASTEVDYVTLRRQPIRQNQEETTTSKYTTILRRRPSTEQPQPDAEKTETEKEKINEELIEITTSTPEENTEQTSEKQEEKEILAVSVKLPSEEGAITTPSSDINSSASAVELIDEASSTLSPTISSTTEKPLTPQLFKPRPFAVRPRPTKTPAQSTTTEAPSTTTRKVSYPLFLRRPPQLRKPGLASNITKLPYVSLNSTIRPTKIPLRKKYISTTPHSAVTSTTAAPKNETVRTTTLRGRFRFATRKPFLRPSTTQATKTSKADDQELSDAGDFAVVLRGLSTAPLPRSPRTTTPVPITHGISTTMTPKTPISSPQNILLRPPQRFEVFTQQFGNQIFEKVPSQRYSSRRRPGYAQIFDLSTAPPKKEYVPRTPPRLETTPWKPIVVQDIPGLATIPDSPISPTVSPNRAELAYISSPADLGSSTARPFTLQELARLTTNTQRSISTTSSPKNVDVTYVSRSPVINVSTVNQRVPEELIKLSTVTPQRSERLTLINRPSTAPEYDYYDSTVLSQLPPNSKVLVLPSGAVQCLDRGNFPHPGSCKKFISCYEGGVGEGIIGWEYTCPRGLSFDPVGGICNWSAGLGCKQIK